MSSSVVSLLSFIVVILSSTHLVPFVESFNYSQINLPDEHLSKYLTAYPAVSESCKNDSKCPFKEHLRNSSCWGYEPGCLNYKLPECPEDHKGWVKTKEQQINTFFTQADFGYIKQQINEMKIICEPLFREDSSLECSENLRFCRGRNIMINLTDLAIRTEPLRYKMDVLSDGQIGGYCTLHRERLESQLEHLSPLQSWAPELRFFKQLDKRPIENKDCDIVIEKPTFIMKIDATVNMYHHFCDFVNLYASLHVNSSHNPYAFNTDVNILIWETFNYVSNFGAAFKAFTDNPILDLKAFRGDTVCFKNVVFPLLPRMIFGLYYNTPLIHGCEGSLLFKSFSEFMLHRLEIPHRSKINNKIKITLLSRDTAYRKILNEDQLLEALEKNTNYQVKRVVFNKEIPFEKQMKIIHETDILIGMHGAGLTHLLFLPDWGVLFELYNCEDSSCYHDLARLRGIKYITWEDKEKLFQQDEGHHPEGGAHAKFTNYAFDTMEFLTLVDEAAQHVRNHPKFILKTLQTKDEL